MSTVLPLPPHASDHLPITIQVQTFSHKQRRFDRYFKFEENWLLWDDCEEVIRGSWSMAGCGESDLAAIKAKISACRVDLKAQGATKAEHEVKAIKQLQNWLNSLNKVYYTDASQSEYLEVSKKLDDLLLKQEIYWAQRSRVAWLKHGDNNTKFFHSKVTQRHRRNHIKGIKNSQEHWEKEVEDIAKVAIDYFDNLFSAGSCDQMEECLDIVLVKVTPEMQNFLSCDFTAEEIKTMVFQMGPTKAPGLNGVNALSYQKFQHVMGDVVVNAVLVFLNDGIMLPALNHTNIVLIPKVKNPEKMSDFRQISLCNVFYKIISKVLANRLKQVLPEIIRHNKQQNTSKSKSIKKIHSFYFYYFHYYLEPT